MHFALLSLITLFALSFSGCANISLDFERDKTPHYRHFATITTGDEHSSSHIDIRKRHKVIQAEKLLYKNGKFSASAVAGRHRQQRWTSGLYMNYEF